MGVKGVNCPTLLSQENQLNKLLHLTRMIAARLFQLRDRERALQLYSDVVATTLSLEEIRKLEGVSACRQRGQRKGHVLSGCPNHHFRCYF